MDWKKMIKTLSEVGFTQQEIADYMGCSQSLVAMLSNSQRGRSLRYEYAAKLIEMVERSNIGGIRPRRYIRRSTDFS